MWRNYISSQFIQFQADFELYQDGVFTEEDLDKILRSRIATSVRGRPRTVIAWDRVKDSYPETRLAYATRAPEPFGSLTWCYALTVCR
jgi:hypothetical protein